jgi:CheY-like chemotaxis protein
VGGDLALERQYSSTSPEPSVDQKSYTVLVAEDHPNGLKIVRVALEKAGYAVLQARDGRSALKQMAHHPDLVILDLALPDIDGFEVIQKLRTLPGGAEMPVIAYSGVMTRLEEARSIEVGFTDYLFKPIVPALLLETIETYLPMEGSHERVGVGQRLLVVDQDPIILNLIKGRLVRAGFAVAHCSDVTQALAYARESPPDLILADILLQQMDGFQFCLTIRKDPLLAAVPVVLFSLALGNDTDRQFAREVGASELVVMSPGYESIINAVTAALSKTPPLATALTSELRESYAQRLGQQLNRQVNLNANIRERLMRREAEMAVLSAFLDGLKQGSVDEILDEMLDRILHTVGVSKGIIYLLGSDGALLPRAHCGFPYSSEQAIGDFFGHAEVLHRLIQEQTPALIFSFTMPEEVLRPSERSDQTALIAPILNDTVCLGALAMMSGTRVFTDEMLPFARTVGARLGQTLGMIKALAASIRSS